MTTFLAGQTIVAATLELETRKVVQRGERTTGSSTTTSTVGVIRLDDLAIIAGRVYKIFTSALNLDTSIANDVVRAEIRYTTDGSTPTTSSSILELGSNKLADAAVSQPVTFSRTYTPAGAETLSLLLCVTRTSGTGSVSILGDATYPIHLWVEDGGVDVGDTGTDI